MVTCERCHRKFASHAAVLEHYKAKHSNITNLRELENQVISERKTRSFYEANLRGHGPSRVRLLAFSLIVIIAIGVIGYVAYAPKSSLQQATTTVGRGDIAPDFRLPSTSGGTFKLSDYRGRSNVLIFFNEGLACQPCLTQMQGLDALNPDFKGLNVVVASITGDSLQTLSDWVQSGGPRWGIVLSDQGLQVSRMYDMLGPTVSMMLGLAPGHSFILVNKSGIIAWRQDYGPYNMNVPNNEIMAAVKQALGG